MFMCSLQNMLQGTKKKKKFSSITCKNWEGAFNKAARNTIKRQVINFMMFDVKWIFDIVYVFDLSKSLLTMGTRVDKGFVATLILKNVWLFTKVNIKLL
jgi:hypothetical protein